MVNLNQASLENLIRELKNFQNKNQAANLQRFFKTGPGQYGAGDVFWGIKVPLQRQIAKRYSTLNFKEIKGLLASLVHEQRLVGLLILVDKYELTKSDSERKQIFDFYLKSSARINNWDLVDLSVYKIMGDYLLRKILSKKAGEKFAHDLLGRLATSANLWERRQAMVSTYAFIKSGRTLETFWLAKQLLNDQHDLIHKAVGWMLREAGKRVSEAELRYFLDEYGALMPRTTLRYAIERLNQRQRLNYLGKA